VDFFTFIVIGIFIYSFFSKKDKAPQRTRRPAENTSRQPVPQESARPMRKKEGFFESIERQIRESAESLEKELQTGRNEKAGKRTPEKIPEKAKGGHAPKPVRESYEGIEGAWGTEGRMGTEGRPGVEGSSDYGKYQSKQGKVIQEKTTDNIIEQTSIERGAYVIGSRSEGLKEAVGFSSAEIVQGTIWSEILKEPRGKRPFFRR